MALIPLTVLRTPTTDYYANTGKPSMRLFDTDRFSGTISAIKSAATVWSTANGSLPGGSVVTTTNINKALEDQFLVVETVPQINTAWALATNTTDFYSTESASVTPHSGGGQGSAVALTKYMSSGTPAADLDSIILPQASLSTNLVFAFKNLSTSNRTAIFPHSGDIIDNNPANTAENIAPGAIAYFWCNGTQWYSIPLVP